MKPLAAVLEKKNIVGFWLQCQGHPLSSKCICCPRQALHPQRLKGLVCVCGGGRASRCNLLTLPPRNSLWLSVSAQGDSRSSVADLLWLEYSSWLQDQAILHVKTFRVWGPIFTF